jgi:hypothetical protein
MILSFPEIKAYISQQFSCEYCWHFLSDVDINLNFIFQLQLKNNVLLVLESP